MGDSEVKKKMRRGIKALPFLAMSLLFTGNYASAAYTGIVEETTDGSTTVVNGDNLNTGSLNGNTAVLYAANGGRVEMYGGSLSSYNTESVGSATAQNNGSIYLEDVNISSSFPGMSGNKKTGLWADTGGDIYMKGGSISTFQYDSFGAWALAGGNITLEGTDISTSGGNGMGLRSSGASTITMSDGSITLTGAGSSNSINAVAYAVSGGKIEITGTDMRGSGNYTYGVVVEDSGSYLSVTDGSITLIGNNSSGAFNYRGTLELDGVYIHTTGTNSDGVESEAGTTNVWSSTIVTENSIGVSVGAGTTTLTDTNITTGGYRSRGIFLGGGKAIANNVQITTNGDQAHGVENFTYNRVKNSLTLNDVQIHTLGDNSHGIYTIDRGSTQFNSGTIKVDGLNSYAIYTEESGEINGSGIYDIQGDIVNRIGGKVDLNFESGSYFKGATNRDSGVIDLTLAGTSRWDMTEDSTMSTLTFSEFGGHVHFDTDLNSNYGTLTLTDLAGNRGTFYMRTDIVGDGAGNNIGDLLVVTDTSAGNHVLSVANQGSAATTGDETLTVVETADGFATFGLTNQVELGGYMYGLRRVDGQETNWELYAAPPGDPAGPELPDTGGGKKPTPSTDAGVNLFSGAYLLNYAETQTLLKRMGDLRGGTQENGVWARVYGGKFSSSGDGFLNSYDMNYWGVQTGYDKKIEREDKKGTVYVGGFFGYSKGNLDYLTDGSGSIDSKSIGAYWTHIHRNGFYADAVLKYNWMKNDFKNLDTAGDLVKGSDISSSGFTGSLEVGRRYFFKKSENGEKIQVQDRQGWYVEPQLQLTVGQQSGGSFTASNGLRIKADFYRSMMGRVETHLGYEVKSGKNPVNVYGKFGVVKEFDGDVDYTLNGSRESTSYGDTWKVWGLGITAKVGKKHDVYMEVERATGGQFTQNWSVNGGYRFSW